MGFLSGKRILVTGVASKLSIAYGIAQAMHREGAELAFTYQNDKLKGRVEEFAAQLGSDIVLQCDVAEDASIDTMFAELGKVWPKFDGFVHSIGFAPGDQLDGDYVNAVTREGFKIAHDISSYSFVAMAKACRSMLNPGSALLTLSYLGAERAIPNYNVMGLAKASLEANVRYMANAMGPEGVGHGLAALHADRSDEQAGHRRGNEHQHRHHGPQQHQGHAQGSSHAAVGHRPALAGLHGSSQRTGWFSGSSGSTAWRRPRIIILSIRLLFSLTSSIP